MSLTTWQSAVASLAGLAWVGVLLSVSVCGLLLVAGVGRLARIRARRDGTAIGPPVVAGPPSGPPARGHGLLDVRAELGAALATVAPQAARQLVALEVAAHPGLVVQADRLGLHELVTSLLLNAIRHAPCGRVLLTASQLGGGVRIAVTDDGVPPDRETLAAALLAAERWAALQGATVDIDVRPGEGTTVAIRLPAPAPD
jgi:signal transduction histidine kinase